MMLSMASKLPSIVFSASSSNGGASGATRGAKACCIPAKYAGAYLVSVLSFKAFSDLKADHVEYKSFDFTSDAFETDPKKMSKELSNLQINSYLSLNGIVYPYYNCEVVRQDLQARGTAVSYEIEVTCKAGEKETVDEAAIARNISDQAKAALEKQAERFLQDYPNADQVKIDGTVRVNIIRI